MASHTKINTYMERHRIGPLFEDLMNKVLRDMPEEPLIYLLRTMYKKAGIEIPQGIRYGGLRKSTSELSRSQSPDRPLRSAQVSSSSDAVGALRDYERPWASPSAKRMKPKKSEDLTASSKKKSDWNADVRTKSTSFDDFWDSPEQARKEKLGTRKGSAKVTGANNTNAWASVGLEEGVETYTSPPYQGTRHRQRPTRQSEDELLANETIPLSRRSKPESESTNGGGGGGQGRYNRGPRLAAEKHRQELSQMLEDANRSASTPQGVNLRDMAGDEDAIDMLENADDLKREGVATIPASGYKLSRAMRHRENEPRVKLSINAYPTQPDDLDRRDPYDTSEQPSPEPRESDDEFESVSQVTGPRHPVWRVPESDGEIAPERSSGHRSRPTEHTQHVTYAQRSLDRDSPAPFTDRSVPSAGDLPLARRTWDITDSRAVSFQHQAPGLPQSSRSVLSQSTSGGWMVPEDTEMASVHDWNQRVKGGSPQDPRSY